MQYRATSLCIIRRGNAILLEQFPEEDGIIAYRPVGGTIEYGEDSKSAVIREVKEEIHVDIIEPRLLGIIELIFPYYGEIGHEFDFIYEAKFACADDYEQEVFEGVEGEKKFTAVWMDLDLLHNHPRHMLVPQGLYDMLSDQGQQDRVSTIKHVSTKDCLTF